MTSLKKTTYKILIFSSLFLVTSLGIAFLLYSFGTSQQPGYGTTVPDFFCGTENYSEKAKEGKAIFQTNCAACHKPTKNMTGPALTVMLETQKFPYPNYIYDFVTNEDSLLTAKKFRTEYINEQYKPEFNHNFNLTTVELDNVVEYVAERSGINKEISIESKGFSTGKDLFKSDCSMCHKINRGIINMREIKRTIDKVGDNYFKAFIISQDSLVENQDVYALRLKKEFNNAGNSHNFNYSEKEINGLIEYIKDY